MTNPMALDASFWSKFVHDSELSASNSTVLQYTMALADRFTTMEDLIAVDEKELISLGITDEVNRACLIKQARLFDDKDNHPSLSTKPSASEYRKTWLDDHQSTPLNPKSICNLSLALLSRISFNDQPIPIDYLSNESTNIIANVPFDLLVETPKRSMPMVNNDQLQTLIDSCQKSTPSTSAYGMRTIKSLSDTISFEKKIVTGSDRLKRLAITKSLLKRRTAMLRKQMSNFKKKIFHPFGKMKTTLEPVMMPEKHVIIKTPSRMVISRSIKPRGEHDDQVIHERGKLQILSLNNDLCRATDFGCRQDQPETSKHVVQPIPTLTTKRFKLVAPTTFVTRSLVNHSQNE